MPEAGQKDTVKVHYTGKLKSGDVFDSSLERDPIEFVIGEQQVLPGFEEAVKGMSPGDKKTVEVPSDQAYGPFHNELVHEVDRGQLPDDADISKGQRFRANTNGGDVVLTVVDSSEETVTLDANHPLAGEDLIFDIELVEIA